jgi:RNA polymerase sigma-70 factor (ECF subfamily)
MTEPTAQFEEHRAALLGLAYRLLGSMWDAEDVVQEGYLRWMSAARDEVKDPKAFLMTIVSRLALDQLRAARTKREAYPGTWLPEPVATDSLGPLDTVELRDTISFATLHLMERLTPPERAVFVLREAFGFNYDELAVLVDKSADNCRQLHHRARRRLDEGRDRFPPSPDAHGKLVEEFLIAAAGDLSGLEALLSEDVTVWNDGGGRVRAALRPILGRDRVIAFLRGLLSKYPIEDAGVTEFNGERGLFIKADGKVQYVSFAIGGGRIVSIFAVLNPDKHRHLEGPLHA